MPIKEVDYMKANWYCINTYYNSEQKVYNQIQNLINNPDYSNYILDCIIPKNNKFLYHQYIFVKIIPNFNIFFKLRHLPGVINFLGQPTPIPYSEIQNTINLIIQ